ncbi:hypothetical protein, partial [Falsiroseomonas oryzae]|uniref:hypothetical protein n=1 Tax=Falsiroseomonas oryzae TaxID=2766473 RepID=UPI0022EB0D8A
MDPRRNQEQIGLFPAAPAPSAAEIDAIRAQAVRARDAAIAASLGRAFARIGTALAAVGEALRSWPQRR